MITQWEQRPYESKALQTSYHSLVESFFQARGYDNKSDIDEFLTFSLKDLTDPSKLKDMDKAVDRLMTAYKKQESICVYGDFDMDGTPALALVVRGLRLLGFETVFYEQADRHKDGYGFHAHHVEEQVKNNNVSVFITVDVGITDIAGVDMANSLGADVLLTDHHKAKEVLPDAYAIVNPNQQGCESGLGHLCGAGVGFYLMMAMRREMMKQGILKNPFDIKVLLDCFAIATVADMVPMIKENRVLVKHGLEVLETTELPGLRSLLQALKMTGKKLTSQDVGIRFVPKLNSLTRIESDIKPRDLFLVETEEEAQVMVRHVMKHNEKRVDLLKEAEALLATMVPQYQGEHCYFFWSEHFHKGLVGLLATKLVQKYQKPAFVGSQIDGVIVGSARAPDNYSELSVFDGLKGCEQHLNRFGGHPAAAGFEVSLDKAEDLKQALESYYTPDKPLPPPVMYFDKEVEFPQVKSFMKSWDTLEPFGFDFSPPLFMMKDLRVQGIRELKGGHIKITFTKDGDSFDALWFFPPEPEKVQAAFEQKTKLSILCEPQWNDFMGSRRVQILIKDLKEV